MGVQLNMHIYFLVDTGIDIILYGTCSELLFRAGAGAGVFFCTTDRGKLLQHKLMRVQCTKKSTRVPVSPVPSTGIRFKQVILKG